MEYNNSDIVNKIEDTLDIIRPYLTEDGGGVEFVRYESKNKILVVQLTGRCNDCPLAIMTLQAGIQPIIISKIPEITKVIYD